jgi:hypothetical protein
MTRMPEVTDPRYRAARRHLLLVLALSGAVAVALRAQERSGREIGAAERGGLEIGADSIWHRTIGFSLPLGDDSIVPRPDLQQMLERQFPVPSEVAVWALRAVRRGQTLIVVVTRIEGDSGFREFTQGIRRGMSRSTFVADSTVTGDSVDSYQLTMRLPSGPYFVTRCLSLAQRPVQTVTCIEALGASRDSLETELARLHLNHGRS